MAAFFNEKKKAFNAKVAKRCYMQNALSLVYSIAVTREALKPNKLEVFVFPVIQRQDYSCPRQTYS